MIGSPYHGTPCDIYFRSGDGLYIEEMINDRQEFSSKFV